MENNLKIGDVIESVDYFGSINHYEVKRLTKTFAEAVNKRHSNDVRKFHLNVLSDNSVSIKSRVKFNTTNYTKLNP